PITPWSHLFQGLKLTDVTGLAYVRHRDYSPTLGRFIERDPIGFEAGDNNWYRFVANGPTIAVDPTGLWIFAQPAPIFLPRPIPKPVFPRIYTPPLEPAPIVPPGPPALPLPPPIPLPPCVDSARPQAYEPKPNCPKIGTYRPTLGNKPWKHPENRSDCSQDQLKNLDSKVDDLCPKGTPNGDSYPGTTSIADTIYNMMVGYGCRGVKELIEKWRACAEARRTRESTCFRGGSDPKHMHEIAKAEHQVAYGYWLMRRWGCFKSPPSQGPEYA
ncbi:MAG: hypothetical protein EBT09_04480, partial [Actinobacteria bacterium]|nr:hypothetical protein [Actinomycetota bacterium]